jgi:hypothetical protein
MKLVRKMLRHLMAALWILIRIVFFLYPDRVRIHKKLIEMQNATDFGSGRVPAFFYLNADPDTGRTLKSEKANRIQIKDGQMNADPCGSGYTTHCLIVTVPLRCPSRYPSFKMIEMSPADVGTGHRFYRTTGVSYSISVLSETLGTYTTTT